MERNRGSIWFIAFSPKTQQESIFLFSSTGTPLLLVKEVENPNFSGGEFVLMFNLCNYLSTKIKGGKIQFFNMFFNIMVLEVRIINHVY